MDKREFLRLLGSAAVAAPAAVIASSITQKSEQPGKPQKTSVFERVIKSRILRCGYIIAAPILVKNENTGQLSGFAFDLATAISKVLGLEIDWAEEVTFATQTEGLKTKRYDMVCSQIYLRPGLMPHVEFTQPYFYVPINVVQRKGETRFKTLADIDRPEIKISGVDGTGPALIAQEDFKKATLYSLPETTPFVETMLSVMTRKADVTFVDPIFFGSFDKNNPGQLEINTFIQPLRVFATIFTVHKGEHDLVTMISAAIQYLLNNGKIDEIIRKYEPFPGAILRVAPPYAAAGKP